MRTFFALLALPFALATIPPELFSPLVTQKVLATAKTPPNPIQFPQYTDATVGNWLLFNPDTWTTGFFPATLYEMNRRQKLCGDKHGVGSADWVKLGQAWSTGEIPLETKTGVGHDVGFLSFPFIEELKMCHKRVLLPCVWSDCNSTEIVTMKLLKQPLKPLQWR